MKKKPVRIQRSRQHKQVSPNGLPIVYVGRPSKWGNPFEVGEWAPSTLIHAKSFEAFKKLWHKKLTMQECLILYKRHIKYLNAFTNRYGSVPMGDKNIKYNLKELKGNNLSCWCKIGEPCHADILLKLANK